MIRKPFPLRNRVILDAILTLLFVLAFGLRFTGELIHELIGLTAFILFALHLLIGWAGIKSMFSGIFTTRRWLVTAVNVFLFATVMAVCVSGLILFTGASAGMGLRQVHTIAAYWTLVLTGLHIGLYWERLVGGVRILTKPLVRKKPWCFAAYLSRVYLLFLLYGIWASFERSIGTKLFFGASFDFWNDNWPVALFFFNHLAVLGVYIAISRYSIKLMEKTQSKVNHLTL